MALRRGRLSCWSAHCRQTVRMRGREGFRHLSGDARAAFSTRPAGLRRRRSPTCARTSSVQPASDAQKIAGCAHRVDRPANGNGSSPTNSVAAPVTRAPRRTVRPTGGVPSSRSGADSRHNDRRPPDRTRCTPHTGGTAVLTARGSPCCGCIGFHRHRRSPIGAGHTASGYARRWRRSALRVA